MKYLFLFLFISTTVFSQNFHYAIDERSGAANPDTTAPTPPLDLVVSNITQATVDLSWTASTDDIGIMVYRVYNNDTLLFDYTETSTTSFTLTGLSPATNYSLTLRAVDAAGNESENSNTQTFSTVEDLASVTRFIMIGASVIKNSFVQNTTLSLINTAYPSESVEFYNEAINGATSTAMAGYIDDIMAKYPYDANKKTYVMVHIGGNDVTRTRPYSTATEGEKTGLKNNLTYILDAIEARGFTPILNTISFRDYDDTTYENEENGSLPYNENIIKPLILSRTPEFAHPDGTSFFQPYELIYNNHETYLHGDNIHPTGSGEGALRNHFVSSICKYIFEGITPTKINKDGTFEPSANLLEEIAALEDAYYLPISEKANLQNALNTYNEVRLGNGDYSGTPITMSGNMKLYGHPTITKVSGITVASGSNGVVINGVSPSGSITLTGNVTNSTFKNIKNSTIVSNGGSLSNNTFLNLILTPIRWDMSATGYFRNNRIIKHWISSIYPQLRLKGNNSTRSYGNVWAWINLLTSHGDATDIDNLDDLTIVGLDGESWNYRGLGNKALLHMRNMGSVRLSTINGGNNVASTATRVFDIQADNLQLSSSIISSPAGASIAKSNTDVFFINGKTDYNLETGTGNDFRGHFSGNNILYNGGNLLSSILTNVTSILNITNLVKGKETKPTPWAKPTFETLPNPSGNNWSSERNGKTDSRAYIQGLIDTNNYAELPEGIYYIGSTLNLLPDQGIIGSGTGKTVIIGLSDNFPLIRVKGTKTSGFTLAHMTLQGGSTGLEITRNTGAHYQPSQCSIKFIVFRNQNYGIHLYECFGLDNNFFDNVSFVNCNVGFMQTPDPSYAGGETDKMTYIDKTVFYQSQVINCGIGFDMKTARANNLNGWINSKFDNCGIALDLVNNNSPLIANCDFTGTTGAQVIRAENTAGIYSCNFYSNRSSNILRGKSMYIEGCNFQDNIPLFSASSSAKGYLVNSTVRGSIGSMPNGMIINSNMQSNTALNKLMVNVVSGTPTVLIDDAPDPYPQLLVSH